MSVPTCTAEQCEEEVEAGGRMHEDRGQSVTHGSTVGPHVQQADVYLAAVLDRRRDDCCCSRARAKFLFIAEIVIFMTERMHLRTTAAWQDYPDRFPSDSACRSFKVTSKD